MVIKSTRYKKLAQNALRFMYQNLKSWESDEKMKQRLLVFSFSSIDLAF